jgi:hypothetical protein
MKPSNKDSEELGRAMIRLQNRRYLEKLIKSPLQETYNRLCDEDGLLHEFMDVVLLLTFVHIDFLGRLYAGQAYNRNTGTVQNAVQFMREYLGRVDNRYNEISGLLYHALRHGYVHVFTPKQIQLQNGEKLDFSFAPYHRKTKHLSVRKTNENENVIYRWSIHVSQLFNDLLSAIDKYAEDINYDQDISDRFHRSFVPRRIEDTEEKLRSRNDIDFIKGFEYIYRQTTDK